MRANPRTRIRPAAHTHAHTHIYAHVRTYTRTRRNFSDNKSALQHCQTEFNNQSDIIHFYYPIAVQSISILAPHWLRHLYKPSASITHLPSIIIHSEPSPNNPPLVCYPFLIHLITLHHLARVIFHLYMISIPTNSPSYQYVSML